MKDNLTLKEKILNLKKELAHRKAVKKLKAQYNRITKENLLTADPNDLTGDEQVMRGMLKQNPDLTLEELRKALKELP